MSGRRIGWPAQSLQTQLQLQRGNNVPISAVRVTAHGALGIKTWSWCTSPLLKGHLLSRVQGRLSAKSVGNIVQKQAAEAREIAEDLERRVSYLPFGLLACSEVTLLSVGCLMGFFVHYIVLAANDPDAWCCPACKAAQLCPKAARSQKRAFAKGGCLLFFLSSYT